MDFKQMRKKMGRFFAWLGLRLCSLVVRVIPARFLYAFARQIGSLGYLLVAKQRRISLESLSIALGKEKTDEELKQIARDTFTSMAKSALELMFLLERPQLLKKRVDFIGRENLDSALSKGKGVILVSAHFGNFPLLLSKLSLEGYSVAGIMRPMHDPRVEQFFLEKRNRLKIRTIYSQPRIACVNNTIDSLRNNAIVFIPIDQNFGSGGIFVDFFGRKAATATGPVVLAQRTQAALVPCFMVRQKDDRHQLIFEPALELEVRGDSQSTLAHNIQCLTNIIESYIRKYPSQWGWVHRRWKSKQS